MYPKNKILVIASLAANKLADLLISAKTTLPALLLSLSAPVWMISWLVPVRESGALLPQAFIGVLLRRYPARHQVWRAGMIVQALSVTAMLLSALYLEGVVAGSVVLGSLILLSLGRAACSLTMKDIQADVADKGERGDLLGIASTVSGVLTLCLAVPLIYFKSALGQTVVLMIIALALAGFVAALFILLPVKTRVSVEDNQQDSSGFSFSQFDSVVYRFIAVRGLFVHSALVAPFFMLEGDADSQSLLPFYLAAQAAATMLSSLVWGRVADKSARLNLQLAGILAVLACAGLLMVSIDSLWWPACLFFVLSVAHTGVRTGRKTYSLDVKEGQQRTELVAFSNTAIGIILLLFGATYAALGEVLPFSVVYTMAGFLIAGVVMTLILPQEKAPD